MTDVFIIGIGQIQFGRHPQESVRSMAKQAAHMALLDAGLEQKDMQAFYFANTFWGMFGKQHSIRGQVVARGMGIEKIPVINVENACAGGATALHLAYTGVHAQMCDVALVVGSEKMTQVGKAESLESYAACLDVENMEGHLRMIKDIEQGFSDQIPEDARENTARSVFMDALAMQALWHMETYGTTREQLAHISSKNHFHGSLNPRAQYQEPMSVQKVLEDAPVTFPFTRSMCAPVTDGAAAAIVCSERFLRKLGAPRPVKIRASVTGQGSDRVLAGQDVAERLAKQAYEMAGVGPGDVSVAELHDATSYAELSATEALGFCGHGEGGAFALSGASTLGGKLPVNTSGGLESQGHPSGASGLAQIEEIVCQLRGEARLRQVSGARIGLTQNAGGNIGLEEAAMCVHILEGVSQERAGRL